MEKERLVKFIATIMEDSGFKIYKNYKVSNQIVDIYGTLKTSVGEVGVVVACKNYEEPWNIGVDVLKDMEIAARNVHASKIIIFTTSNYTHRAALYAQKRNIKLVGRKGLIEIAKNYSKKHHTVLNESIINNNNNNNNNNFNYEYYETENNKRASLNPHSNSNLHELFSTKSLTNNGNNFRKKYSKKSYNLGNGNLNLKNRLLSDITGSLSCFSEHSISYMIFLLLIASSISYILNIITSGPYTGIGKIVSSFIICFGGLLLLNRDLSDVLFKGFIIFFISIIISIVTAAI